MDVRRAWTVRHSVARNPRCIVISSRRASPASVLGMTEQRNQIEGPGRQAVAHAILALLDRDDEIHALMTKYRDRPMDFADATLVHLAARESMSFILTIDGDDFETYRIGGRKKFTILPGRGTR